MNARNFDKMLEAISDAHESISEKQYEARLECGSSEKMVEVSTAIRKATNKMYKVLLEVANEEIKEKRSCLKGN